MYIQYVRTFNSKNLKCLRICRRYTAYVDADIKYYVCFCRTYRVVPACDCLLYRTVPVYHTRHESSNAAARFNSSELMISGGDQRIQRFGGITRVKELPFLHGPIIIYIVVKANRRSGRSPQDGNQRQNIPNRS